MSSICQPFDDPHTHKNLVSECSVPPHHRASSSATNTFMPSVFSPVEPLPTTSVSSPTVSSPIMVVPPSDSQKASLGCVPNVNAIDFTLDIDPNDTFTEIFDAYYNVIGEAAEKCGVTINEIMNHVALYDQHFSYIYRLIMDKHKIKDSSDLQSVLVAAAKDWIINVIRKFVDRMDQETMNKVMKKAALYGNIDIVRLMLNPDPSDLSKGAINYNDAMYEAAGYGNIDIVRLMLRPDPSDLSKGATNYKEAMTVAARYGYIDIVELMLRPVLGYFTEGTNTLLPSDLSKGATDYNSAMYVAARYGHIDIVRLMLSNGAYDYNLAMYSAAEKGHIDIVRLMLNPDSNDPSKGAKNYDLAMSVAAEKGHIDIVRLMLNPDSNDPSKGAEIYGWAMSLAVGNGHIDILELIKAHVATLR